MERPSILHLFTPGRQPSPFDVNMAADAGYDMVVPYCEVTAEGVTALVQDAIFSRSPKGLQRTALFIGGRDALLASDMLARAKAAMFKPFVVSLMADPSGAYTTAAARVACVEAALQRQGRSLSGCRVLVLGGTGPVGRIAGVIAARAGAEVHLSSRQGQVAAQEAARETGAHFGATLQGTSGSDAVAVAASVAEAEVLLACAAAGVQVVPAEALKGAKRLRVAADVNAVAPPGIAGIGVQDDGGPLGESGGVGGAVGIGALAVGKVKYQTQHRLLVRMHQADKPLVLGVDEAFAEARAIVAEKDA